MAKLDTSILIHNTTLSLHLLCDGMITSFVDNTTQHVTVVTHLTHDNMTDSVTVVTATS